MTSGRSLSNEAPRLPLCPTTPRLGVLSIHLDGAACRVGCRFCYLGAREHAEGLGQRGESLDIKVIEALLERLDYAEVAVALSEPAEPLVAPLSVIVRAAEKRGRPVTITTTAAVLEATPALASGVSRVNLSVDPSKGDTAPEHIESIARGLRAPGREVVLIVTLSTERFAESLVAGGLESLLALPSVDKVALSGLKPPPPWCDTRFWLRSLSRLAPLVGRHLDRRLFLDCYVAARILGLGECPARPDVSPGNAFRACVYQPKADFHFADADDLASRLEGFTAPERCPFPIA